MKDRIDVVPKIEPELDPEFVPAVLWNRQFRKLVAESGKPHEIAIVLDRLNGSSSVFRTRILPETDEHFDVNLKYVERLVKSLLWVKGGWRVTVGGSRSMASGLARIYSANGVRQFDYGMMGEKYYGRPMEVAFCELQDLPRENEVDVIVGGNLDGCRIGFDLGGSDRKCAAVIDGKVVFTEEVPWDPYFQKDPAWHRAGIDDSLKKAAMHLPRVDAIGGSSAGVYVNNQVRAASLFRGVSDEDFRKYIVNLFLDIQKDWNVPLVVLNDGEVTALAGAMSFSDTAILGVSMGTSMAGGYVKPSGSMTDWLNELAFVPVDYREDAPVDEWSGDRGCGVQYFSQQGVARLAPRAGISFPEQTPFADQLVEVQKLMKAGDTRAVRIYSTIGTCFGYAVAHYAEFYEIRNLLFLGRVSSGSGGEVILSKAQEVLKAEFPEIAGKIRFRTPDEKMKRHGQAVAAASLPKSGR